MAARVLVVGAGAVGQVLALHLSRGGAELSFLVRPEHALEPELVLFKQAKRREVLRYQRRLVTFEEVASSPWDQVWLTLPLTSLEETWMRELLSATSPATVVSFGPETGSRVPVERRVVGGIPFMAWQTPLPEETGERGIGFWVPPLAQVPLSGPHALVEPARSLLAAGGLAALEVSDTAKLEAPMTALLICLVAALENAGWAFEDFRGKWPETAARAAREAMRIDGAAQPWPLAARAGGLRFVLWLGARVLPFNLERYLRFHFTKVGAQTRSLLERWLRDGRARSLPVEAIAELAEGLHRSP
jgi:2-dehydropantoate 2-reductase